MPNTKSTREYREHLILKELSQGARRLGALTPRVGFTCHDGRVHRLLSGLGDRHQVVWRAGGEWEITDSGRNRLKQISGQ